MKTCLGNMLVVAGWRQPARSSTLEAAVLVKISEIIAKAVKIREVVAEGILSTHVEAYTFESGRPFNPEIMQDAYAIPGKSPTVKRDEEDAVVCATSLGLLFRSKKVPSSGSDGGEWKFTFVVKPKVLLESTLS